VEELGSPTWAEFTNLVLTRDNRPLKQFIERAKEKFRFKYGNQEKVRKLIPFSIISYLLI
jgi:hypothetical protein